MSKVRELKVSKLHNAFIGNMSKMLIGKDDNIISKYTEYLNSGEYDVSSYFNLASEPYNELSGWFDNKNEAERDELREKGARYAGQLYRIISKEISKDVKKNNTFGDRRDAKKVLEAFNTGSVVKCKNFFKQKGSFSSYKRPLREVAWYVVHSYVTTYFWSCDSMIEMMSNVTDSEKWNFYINEMDDIPQEVKDIFYLDDEGKSIFQKNYTIA